MATTKIGEFLVGLAQRLNVREIGELIFVLIVMAAMYKMRKKKEDKERWGWWIMSATANCFLAVLAPFALLQLITAFGLIDADLTRLAFTPLDIMFGMSMATFFVMSGKKLFGTIDITPPAEINGDIEDIDGVKAATSKSHAQ